MSFDVQIHEQNGNTGVRKACGVHAWHYGIPKEVLELI